MENDKKSIEYKNGWNMGRVVTLTFGWCLTACVVVTMVAATYRFIFWLLNL